MISYVFDSSSLIYLGKLKLLEKIDNSIHKFIPEKVYKEVVEKGLERNELEAEYVNQLIEDKFFNIKSAKTNDLAKDVLLLSAADKEVLSLAREIKSIAIIDEIYASEIADSMGIESHGSLYIILGLIKRGKIAKKDAVKYVNRIIESGFYLSAIKYKEILDLIKRM